MTTQYVLVPFKFDMAGFAAELKEIDHADLKEFAGVIGVDHSTLENWRNGSYLKRESAYPSMGNFLSACNWLDLDPRAFFILEEK